VSTAREWVRIPATEEMIGYAKRLRAKRDERYANVYPEAETDWRWVGELGECAVYKWLQETGTPNFEWITGDPSGRADFVVCGETVDVKTSKRKDAIKQHYEVGVTGHCAESQHAETLLFCCYEISTGNVVILGAMAHGDFLAGARYFGPGEKVHDNFTVREGSNLYNVHISQMDAPLRWLEG
jgi:hypothetical protein